MLKWLLGAKRDTAAKAAGEGSRRIRRDRLESSLGSVIHLPELDFIGHHVVSPNGRYILLWRDGNNEGTRGGARESGLGRYYLIDGDQVVAEGRAERPNDGHVADNGTFTLNDWRFASSLCGVFLAFRADGDPIIARAFAANIFNSGLSSDGRRAVCQACNAPNSSDSSRLVFFDLETGVETGSCVPESGWAASYAFSEDGDVVRLQYREGKGFDYAFDGRFIERDAWMDASLAGGDIYMAQRLLKAAGDSPAPELLTRLIQSLDGFLVNASNQDPRLRALALKLKGMCFEGLGAPEKALRAYEAALANDPKIGVKRRVDQLRKSQ